MSTIRCLPSVVLGSVVAFAGAGSAVAQDALGSGNVLDANPAVGSGGRNLPSLVEDFRARNLLITGNVAAGRGFRGTVGYTAENDFRGAMGSNDLFGFRAETAFSSPGFVAAGRTFERLRFGQHLGVVEFRRAGYGATLGSLREKWRVPNELIDDRLRLDRITLSSSTAVTYEALAEPEIVGVFQREEGGAIAASVSSLRGLQLEPLGQQGQLLGLTSYDLARIREDMEARGEALSVGAPFLGGFGDLRLAESPQAPQSLEGRVEPQTPQTRIAAGLEPDYEKILKRVARRYAASVNVDLNVGPELFARLDEQLEQLREQLAEPDRQATPDFLAEATLPADETTPLKIEHFGVILRHGEQLKRLASDDRTRFNELLASAEEQLRDGEYFRAERRFIRALRFVPGHPLATAGMAHAQIGAGLYVPASLALRRLLSHHPEMIDVQYGPNLLPSRVRLNMAVRTLRQHMTDKQRDRTLNAFLLAYIGHQLAERALIEEGLKAVADDSPADPLLPLLEAIWLGKSDEQPPAAEQPQPEK